MNGMEAVAERLSLYHDLFFLCLAGTVVSLGISVTLFIRLEIKNALRLWFDGPKPGKKECKARVRPNRRKGKQFKNQSQKTTQLSFCVEREMMFIHTEEEI